MLDELSRKIDRAKHAAGSYLHDQADQTQAYVKSYAVAIGLYAAAAISLIATLPARGAARSGSAVSALVIASSLFEWAWVRRRNSRRSA